MSAITLADFEALIAEAYRVDAEIDKLKRDTLAPLAKKLGELEAKILEELTAQDKTSYKSNCGTVVRSNRYSVQTPKTIEQKQEFFRWLNAKGAEIYWQYITVNSQSLNSLYKEEQSIAIENGDLDFAIPGIGEPTVMPTLSRRSK